MIAELSTTKLPISLPVDIEGVPFGFVEFTEVRDGRAIFTLKGMNLKTMLYAGMADSLLLKIQKKFGPPCMLAEDDKDGRSIIVFTKDAGKKVRRDFSLLRSVRSDIVRCITDTMFEYDKGI